jgi:ribonuclease E
MGISPLILMDKEIKDPKSVVISVKLPVPGESGDGDLVPEEPVAPPEGEETGEGPEEENVVRRRRRRSSASSD